MARAVGRFYCLRLYEHARLPRAPRGGGAAPASRATTLYAIFGGGASRGGGAIRLNRQPPTRSRARPFGSESTSPAPMRGPLVSSPAPDARPAGGEIVVVPFMKGSGHGTVLPNLRFAPG